MDLLFNLALLLVVFHWCAATYYDGKCCFSANDSVKSANVTNCTQFFHGKAWPLPKDIENRGIVKLCQTQVCNNNVAKPVFATIFSTVDRIPVYTANTITLHLNAFHFPRPKEETWDRLAMGLCNIDSLPAVPINSDLNWPSKISNTTTCQEFQAESNDYVDNGMHLDRGHLSPNSINSESLEKQCGTFTLTNAAPQFSSFNEHSWRIYECVTQNTILDLVPSEVVYIITGTYGTALDKSGHPLWMNNKTQSLKYAKSPVKVPKYYWKAVCYPGNPSTSKSAWGYAIVKENINEKGEADYKSYITLKEFAAKYFKDPPFGEDCMNATFGNFSKFFGNWTEYLKSKCSV